MSRECGARVPGWEGGDNVLNAMETQKGELLKDSNDPGFMDFMEEVWVPGCTDWKGNSE